MTGKRVRLSVAEKTEILKKLEKGEVVVNISEQFNVSIYTVNKIKRQRTRILQEADKIKTTEGDVKKRKSVKSPTNRELEGKMYEWFKEKRNQGVPITGPMIQEKALQINLEVLTVIIRYLILFSGYCMQLYYCTSMLFKNKYFLYEHRVS